MWGIGEDWQGWIRFLVAVVIAVSAALACHYLIVKLLSRFAKRSVSPVDELVVKHLRRPAAWLMVVVSIRLAADVSGVPAGLGDFVRHIVALVLIGLVSWLLIRGTSVLMDVAVLRFKVDVKDNLLARRIHTQLSVLRRLVVVVIIVIAVAAMLMTFPKVRQLGTAMLASAGIVGVVVGLAAQKTIGTFIAGLQIAITQPIRIDDVVIVEGEWGRIEEITLTYVVVRIWDLRRLVIPITYFIERPFQNWTRTSADILGTVFLYVDYTVPVDAIRAELRRILEGSEFWDRKVCGLQVTNASERTIEVRALMSADDASLAWNLRCHVREKLVEFVQRNYPHALPRLRTEFEGPENRSRDDT